MIAVFIYTLIVLLYFNPLLTSRVIFVERDLSAFFIPPRYLWIGLVKSGQLPLWNPHNYSGVPLLATLQPGVFYPPHIFYLFLPFSIVWNWLIIFHFVFAGFTVYRFLRYLNASWPAAFTGGAVFMLCGYLLSVHNLITHLFAVAWFPLVVMSFMKFFDTSARKYLVYTATFLSMEFLAGAPEIVFMTFLIVVLLTVREIWVSNMQGQGYFTAQCKHPGLFYKSIRQLYPVLAIFGSVVILFILLSAIQLLPFIELKMNSIRKAGLSFEEATIWSFAWKDFILFLMPDAFGNISKFNYVKFWSYQSWLKTMYIGMTPILLSFFYFAGKNKYRVTFGVIALLSFLFALGSNTPFYKFLHLVPPFNSLRYPVKFLFPLFFVISIASGLGFDKLMTGIKEKDKIVNIIANLSFCLGCLFFAGWIYISLFRSNVDEVFKYIGWIPDTYNDIAFNIHNLKRLLFFTFGFTTLLFLFIRSKRKVIFGTAMIFLLIADLFLANYGFYHSMEWQKYIEAYGFGDKLNAERVTGRYMITSRTMRDLESIFSRPPLDKMALAPPYAALHGAYSIDGAEVMRVHYQDYFLQIMFSTPTLKDAKRMFDISGVQYLITSYKPNDRDFICSTKMTLNAKDLFLCEYSAHAERFLLFGTSISVETDKEAKDRLFDNSLDLRREVILIGWPGATLLSNDIKGSVDVVSYRANRVELRYTSNGPAFLYASDTYYPGWRAYVDGKRTKIYRANLAFRAIKVPAGKHIVVFKYIPMSFYIGLVLSLFGIAFCIWLCRRDGTMPISQCDERDANIGNK